MKITFDLELVEDDMVEGWVSCPKLAQGTQITLKPTTVGGFLTGLSVMGVGKTVQNDLEDILRGF